MRDATKNDNNKMHGERCTILQPLLLLFRMNNFEFFIFDFKYTHIKQMLAVAAASTEIEILCATHYTTEATDLIYRFTHRIPSSTCDHTPNKNTQILSSTAQMKIVSRVSYPKCGCPMWCFCCRSRVLFFPILFFDDL